MRQWTHNQIVLQNENFVIKPLNFDNLEELYDVANNNYIWQHTGINLANKESFYKLYTIDLENQASDEEYPFIILDKKNEEIIGAVNLSNISIKDKHVAIRKIWFNPKYWGYGIHLQVMQMLLTYCFEVVNVVRVEFTFLQSNTRFLNAITKTGASFEGNIRKSFIHANGEHDNTIIYSIIDLEWPHCKVKISQQLSSTTNSNSSATLQILYNSQNAPATTFKVISTNQNF
jgi:N-acetyltransferase